jgi:hypothetical protein
MELCDFANALSDMRPREFATVTRLAPVMELDVQGHVFAITGSEGRNGSMCFLRYEKGHFARACPLLTVERRQKAMEARDRFYKSDRANWQERRFNAHTKPYTGDHAREGFRRHSNFDDRSRNFTAGSGAFFLAHRSLNRSMYRETTPAASREPCWRRASSLAT